MVSRWEYTLYGEFLALFIFWEDLKTCNAEKKLSIGTKSGILEICLAIPLNL